MPHFSLLAPENFDSFAAADGAVVLDTRPAAAYWAGHLPGARHLDAALLALPRTDAPSVARFQALLAFALSALGLQTQSPVLLVGAAGEVNVARAAWALAYAGIGHVAVLDGGLQALPGAALQLHAVPVVPTAFVVKPVSHLLASAQEVQAAGSDTTLIDAREHEEFLGRRSNAGRHGRIPGALHWDTAAEVDGQGRLQSVPALAELGDAGVADGGSARRIVYCAGGGRAARTFLALQLAGHGNTAVYPGSWGEWGNQPDLPIESGQPHAVSA